MLRWLVILIHSPLARIPFSQYPRDTSTSSITTLHYEQVLVPEATARPGCTSS